MNIKEEFENYIFEAVKEISGILKYSSNQKDLDYVKEELTFLKNRYSFIKRMEKEFETFYEIYKIMNRTLYPKDENILNVVPFENKNIKHDSQ